MSHANPPATSNNIIDPELILEMFDYRDLQDLNGIGERMEELILVTRLNRGALEDTTGFYQSLTDSLMDSEGIPDESRQAFKKTVPPFVARVKAVSRRLETRQLQLESLSKKLEEGKTMVRRQLGLVSKMFHFDLVSSSSKTSCSIEAYK